MWTEGGGLCTRVCPTPCSAFAVESVFHGLRGEEGRASRAPRQQRRREVPTVCESRVFTVAR